MASPTPELPDETPIGEVEFPSRIRNVLTANDLKTVGEIRETSDAELLTVQNCGVSTVAYLRKTLGFPSTDGVKPPANLLSVPATARISVEFSR